jgi:hypothetical protein
MGALLTILILWFLVSIVVGLLIGRVFTVAQDDAGTGRGTPQRLPSRSARPIKDTIPSSF